MVDFSRKVGSSCALVLLVVTAAIVEPVTAGLRTAQAAAASASVSASAELGTVRVRSRTVEFGQTVEPRLLTVTCGPDEQLLSGGYAATSPGVNVIASYPSDAKGTPSTPGERNRSWTVAVLNRTKSVPIMAISASCLVGGDGSSAVQVASNVHTDSVFGAKAACPAGSTVTGGGYWWQWTPRSGGAAIVGSYPLVAGPVDSGWGIDGNLLPGDPDVPARATVSVFALCRSGDLQLGQLTPTMLNLLPGSPRCVIAVGFAADCSTPRVGAQRVTCGGGQLLTGSGYQVASGSLPGPYSVLIDRPIGEAANAWDLGVNGSSPDGSEITMRVTPICLAAVLAATATSAVAQPPLDLTASEPNWPLVAGIGLLVLLLLLALLTGLVILRRLRRPSRGQPSTPAPRIEVTLRSYRSGFRFNEFRELP